VTKHPIRGLFGTRDQGKLFRDLEVKESSWKIPKCAGHTNTVPWVAASPVENSVITCSADHRARFWTEEQGNSPNVPLM
jgi:WD40 repeat protein